MQRFEAATLSEAEFRHADHVRLAWLYLRGRAMLPALTAFSEGLRNFAAAHGKSGRYHETITWAFMFLIRERMESSPSHADWQNFARHNPDLLDWPQNILTHYYRPERLSTELARRVFVLPEPFVCGPG
jgi:hypothetical protein